MILVEQHVVNKNNPNWKRIDELSFLSKNLFNTCLWTIKNHFEETGKYIWYNELYKKFYNENNPDFLALPIATSHQIMMLMDKNMKSYFALLRRYRKNNKSLNGCPKFPKFKHPVKGRNIIIFRADQARIKQNGTIKFPKRAGLSPLKTKITSGYKQVRIVPQHSCYVIEVVYEKAEIQANHVTDSWMSIDIGVNNLMTCFDTECSKPTIVSGRPIKYINQYWNKKKAKLQSDLVKQYPKRKTSKKLQRLTTKRNRKVKDYMHKASRFIVDTCLETGISNIVVGYNKDWKTGINIGKKNNQNFVQIPYDTLINQIEYKAKLLGISVLRHEESYTSKCSAMDLEPVKKHETYVGKRVKRGMFQTSTGQKINADLNGALNILRKINETGDKEWIDRFIQTQSGRGQVVWPFQVKLDKCFKYNLEQNDKAIKINTN